MLAHLKTPCRCGPWMNMFLLLLTWYSYEDGVSLCWHDVWMKMIFSWGWHGAWVIIIVSTKLSILTCGQLTLSHQLKTSPGFFKRDHCEMKTLEVQVGSRAVVDTRSKVGKTLKSCQKKSDGCHFRKVHINPTNYKINWDFFQPSLPCEKEDCEDEEEKKY